jgi:peptide/nickel transport system substrate-binding protein
VTVLLNDDVLTLNPNEEVEVVTDSVLSNVYEPLITLDENLSPRTALADSWEHPRPERWRFHLRQGVRFHDGTLLTAQHVRDFLTAIQKTSDLEAAEFLSQIREVTVVDEHTLDVTTQEPRAILADLPFLYIAKANAPGTFPPFSGTGPYQVKEWTPGQKILLVRSPDYWGPPSSVREALFVPTPDPQLRLAKLRAGEADLVTGLPPELAKAWPGVRLQRQGALGVFYLGYDLRHARDNPLNDIRVRRAFSLALDRRRLVDEVLDGNGSIPTQPVAPAVFGYNPELPALAFDPQAARRLLGEAGYPHGFLLKLDYPLNHQGEALRIRDDLLAIGVKLDLNGMHRDAVYDLAKSGKSAFFLVGWDCPSGVASEFYEFCLHTPTARYGLFNYGGYSNLEIDRIAETNAAILDQHQRRALLQRAAAIAMDELPVLPLFVQDDLYASRAELLFRPRPDGRISLVDISFR